MGDLVRRFRHIILSLSSFIVILLIPLTASSEQAISDPKVVEIQKAKKGNITQTIRLIGTVKAKRSIDLTARSHGVLEQVVQSGQRVSKGTLVAKLDNTELEKSLVLAEESAHIAKNHYQRLVNLAKSNAVSKRTLDEAKNQWLDAQRAHLNAKIDCEKTYFRAPFDGYVGVYRIRAGAQVREGTKIVTFYDPSELGVEFDIPAKYLTQIHPGQKVIINQKTYTLAAVQNMIDPDTLMSPVYLDFSGDNCFIGETIDVDLLLLEHQNTCLIPASSVFQSDGKQSVYVVKENMAVLVPVELGIKEKDQIEITKGVEIGDLIIFQGQARLYPGCHVKTKTSAEIS